MLPVFRLVEFTDYKQGHNPVVTFAAVVYAMATALVCHYESFVVRAAAYANTLGSEAG
jgi:hypothetical protein